MPLPTAATPQCCHVVMLSCFSLRASTQAPAVSVAVAAATNLHTRELLGWTVFMAMLSTWGLHILTAVGITVVPATAYLHSRESEPLSHKVHIYLARVPQCLLPHRNWDLPTPSPNSDDWRKSLALCLPLWAKLTCKIFYLGSEHPDSYEDPCCCRLSWPQRYLHNSSADPIGASHPFWKVK